jgi:hypothetical protein
MLYGGFEDADGIARLLRLDPRKRSLTDLGRVSETESTILRLVVGSDGHIYGGTYPGAKLVRYRTDTRHMEDLGRMDPTEMYATDVAASRNGFVYVTTGYARFGCAAYEIASGEHRRFSRACTATGDSTTCARVPTGMCMRSWKPSGSGSTDGPSRPSRQNQSPSPSRGTGCATAGSSRAWRTA